MLIWGGDVRVGGGVWHSRRGRVERRGGGYGTAVVEGLREGGGGGMAQPSWKG